MVTKPPRRDRNRELIRSANRNENPLGENLAGFLLSCHPR